jgi:serine/threonine protein kinase
MAPYIKVGQYILKKKIGEGAFAEVRHAIHCVSGKEFAVKVFDRAAFPRSDFERDIKREIKIMKHLRHPGIVSIHEVLVTEQKMYLVMELVHGGELYDEIINKRRVDEKTSRKYFQQLVDAIVYCHRRGVVHRDLKPENLLLTTEGKLKITDFGMSALREANSKSNDTSALLQTQCGTPYVCACFVVDAIFHTLRFRLRPLTLSSLAVALYFSRYADDICLQR